VKSAGDCRGPPGGTVTPSRSALLEHAFAALGLHRVWAEAMAVNARSRRVMDRLGMTHVRTYVDEWDDPIPGWEQGEVVYEIRRSGSH
jgi:RimJ/RimL family protein N-acetyltransferase